MTVNFVMLYCLCLRLYIHLSEREYGRVYLLQLNIQILFNLIGKRLIIISIEKIQINSKDSCRFEEFLAEKLLFIALTSFILKLVFVFMLLSLKKITQ